LEGLSTERKVTARVVNCVSLGPYEKFWIIGLALDAGNVWRVQNHPEDWLDN
jgi:hypothetical protein